MKNNFTREQVISFASKLLGVYVDYPFKNKSLNTAVVRHKIGKKIFVLVGVLNGKEYVNVKCEPMEADFLRSAFKGVTAGYHMNKTHWNSVWFNEDVDFETLKKFIENSYEITKPKPKKHVKLRNKDEDFSN